MNAPAPSGPTGKATICFTFGSGDFSGGPRMGYYFAREFARRGHPVLAICQRIAPEEKLKVGGKALREHLEEAGIEVIEDDRFPHPLSPGLVARVVKLARSRHAALIVSMIQADVKIACVAGAITRIPVVVSAQNIHHFGGPKPVAALKRALYGWLVGHIPALVVCSAPPVRAELLACAGAAAAARMELLPNCVESARFGPISPAQRAACRAELGVQEGDILLTNVGRLDEQKGQLILLPAFQELAATNPRLKLLLVGEAIKTAVSEAYAAEVRALALQPGLAGRVILPGWRSDVSTVLRSSDIYVHSALWEGLPLAILEALAAELPVITTDCFGSLSIAGEDLRGWTVPAGESVPLQRAMAAATALDVGELRQMGQRNGAFARQHYDVEKIGARFADLALSHIRP